MPIEYKPMAEYYKQKEETLPCNRKNTIILVRLEKDLSQLQTDITQLRSDMDFIKNYITIKKERENKGWFQ